jgi:hypothetical protein
MEKVGTSQHLKNTVFTTWAVAVAIGFAGCAATETRDTDSRPEITGRPGSALQALGKLAIKGRAPKTGYNREEFGGGWDTEEGCTTRERILRRDLVNIEFDEDDCQVTRGILPDPYTGKRISFVRGIRSSNKVQIDHVAALGDVWQKGAQQLSASKRRALSNDPLELLAVDGRSNSIKGDSDAASWLPSNRSFRCSYVARQIAVKLKYGLWVTKAEHNTMQNVLQRCPNQALPK